MHIIPIINAMLRNRISAILIIVEIALTLALISNAMYIAVKSMQRINKDSGLDIEHLVSVNPQGVSVDFDVRQAVIDDLRSMRNIPEIVSASPLGASMPGVGFGGGTVFYIGPEESSHNANLTYYQSDESIVDTLELKLISGRNFTRDDIQELETRDATDPGNILISRALAIKLFPDGNALGKPLWQNNFGEPAIVIGIYERMAGQIFDLANSEFTAIFPQVIYERGYDPNYIFRTKPGTVEKTIANAEEALSKTPGRVATLRQIKQTRSRVVSNDRALSRIMIFVMTLLVLVTVIGIAGLATFSVNKRRKQIGTRRALGARKVDILSYFLIENWLMTITGIVIGIGLAFSINLVVANIFNADPIKISYILYCSIGLWFLGSLAVWGPAKRASEIEPAIATRNV